MLFGHASLNLSRVGETNPVVLIPSFEAMRLGRNHRQDELGPAEVCALFDAMASRNRSLVRQFVKSARLTRTDLRDVDDHRIGTLVSRAIRDGSLVALRAFPQATPAPDERSHRRELVREIEAKSGSRLELAGRRYVLLADQDLARMPGRDHYEVVNRELAGQVLSGLADKPGTSPELARLLGQARDHLAPDWRPPWSQPDGLVLLRRIDAPRVFRAPREQALTPSQLKALTEAGWIEIEFVDSLGQPVAAVCRLELPDSTPVETGEGGQEQLARHGFAPGQCRLTLPKLDAAAWRLSAEDL